jgi:hypothetical protein
MVLRTEFASVAGPLVELVDNLRARGDERVIVLIPVVVPARLRYQLLHNHLDQALSYALRHCDGVVVARVRVPLEEVAGDASPSAHAAG